MTASVTGPGDAGRDRGRSTGPAAAATAPLRAAEAGLLACVHCGFCLNACPTYRRLGHEGDSPRGRLDLMRAVSEGRLAPDDPAFQLHIDQCLGCRACEPVCPSGVPYGFLLERARTAIARSAGVSASTRLLIATFTGSLRPLAGGVSRLARALGLARLAVRLLPARVGAARFAAAMLAASAPWPGLRRAAAPAPAGSARGAAAVPTSAPPRGGRAAGSATAAAADAPGAATADVATDAKRAFADPHALAGAFPAATGASGLSPRDGRRVGILVGCVQEELFHRVNAATVRVLEANGWEVVRVRGQRCCGALDAHAGRLERAQALARHNIAAFEAAGVDRVVVNAAGCGAIMKEYGEQLEHDTSWAARAEALAARVSDLAELLVADGIRTGAPLPLRVTYDAPCHLHHGQRIRQAPLDLLDAIPGLLRIPLADADECCGGAGLYGVHHPELGGRILRDKVEAIVASGAEVVATPNPGCMMQIGAGLLLAGSAVAVVHPVELLDESYRREGEVR